jgi:hypothetical protein
MDFKEVKINRRQVAGLQAASADLTANFTFICPLQLAACNLPAVKLHTFLETHPALKFIINVPVL